MRVEVECTAEALEEGDRAGLAVGEAQAPAAVALPGEDDAEEEADQLAEELRVAGEGEAEREGEAEQQRVVTELLHRNTVCIICASLPRWSTPLASATARCIHKCNTVPHLTLGLVGPRHQAQGCTLPVWAGMSA